MARRAAAPCGAAAQRAAKQPVASRTAPPCRAAAGGARAPGAACAPCAPPRAPAVHGVRRAPARTGPATAPAGLACRAVTERDAALDFNSFGLVVSREYAVTLRRDQPLGEPPFAGGTALLHKLSSLPLRAAACAAGAHPRARAPTGLLFAQQGDAIVVSEVQAGTQAARGVITPGDILRRTSAVFGDELWDASDFRRTMCVPMRARRARGALMGRAPCALSASGAIAAPCSRKGIRARRSAIQQRRGDDVTFVLERQPRDTAAARAPRAPPPCDAVGGGRQGAVWSVGAGAMGLASFSLDAGALRRARHSTLCSACVHPRSARGRGRAALTRSPPARDSPA
jgi:hypothetical protein